MIDIKLSERLNGVQESSTLKMNQMAKDLAAKGLKVINLTAGEPDFPILDAIKKETILAIEKDFNKYTAVAGIPELKSAIANKLNTENLKNVSGRYKPDEILLSCGAKHSIYNFLMAVVSPGDEVIFQAPYWVSYPEMVRLCGGKPVIIPSTQENGFKITPQDLKKHINNRTKVFIFNSPSNPTGAVYSRKEMAALADVLKGTNILVCSDEIYEMLTYTNEPFSSFADLSEDAFERTTTINGFSKSFSMTGWRLGYAATNQKIIKAMSLIQSQSTSNPTSIVQKGALKALSIPTTELQPMVQAFKKRKKLMGEILSQCKNCSFHDPEGAFYIFLNVERLIGKKYTNNGKPESLQTSEDLAFFLLNHAQVVTVPGSGFGAEGYLRISYAVSDSDVLEGSQKIVKAFEMLS